MVPRKEEKMQLWIYEFVVAFDTEKTGRKKWFRAEAADISFSKTI